MKKSTLFYPSFTAFFIFTLLVSTAAFAQAPAFGVGTNVIAIQGALGQTVMPGGPGHHLPVIDLQYDRGIWHAGKGVISLGAFGGYGDYNNYSIRQPGASAFYPQRVTFTTVGVRGAYHFAGWRVRNLDAYVGIKVAYEGTSSNGYTDPHLDQDVSSIQVRPLLGARYFFLPYLGVLAELGFNAYQALDMGLVVKL
jgi:hypothetical protein